MKAHQRVAAVVIAAGISLAALTGVASASESGASTAAEEKGPVETIVGALGGVLGGVAHTVDGVVGQLL